MRSKKITLKNENGIHEHVAKRVIEKSRNLDSCITVHKGSIKADGSSILELLLLDAEKGSEIELIVDGGDEEKNLRELSELFSDGAGI